MSPSRKKILTLVVLLGAILLWYFFGREEARFLRAAKKVRNVDAAEELCAKFGKGVGGFTGGRYNYAYDVWWRPFFLQQHHLIWDYDSAGRITGYHHLRRGEVFWMQFTPDDEDYKYSAK